MSAGHDLERRLADHFASEAPRRAPDWVLRNALTTIGSTRQRRVLIPVPWRFPALNTYAKVAIAAIAVVAIGVAGLALLRGGEPQRIVPGARPEASPAPSVTPAPSAAESAGGSPPPLTGRFTSPTFGISISYPEGWKLRPAEGPWTDDVAIGMLDQMYLRETDSPFVAVASQPLAGADGQQWADDYLTTQWPQECGPQTEEIAIDGRPGLLTQQCGQHASWLTAVTWTEDRGYLISLYRVDDLIDLYGIDHVAWFKQILATVDLRPEEAVD